MKRRALIIGGTGSIGSEIANALAPTSDLFLVYRQNAATASDVVSRIRATHPQANVETLAHPLDHYSSVESLKTAVLSHWTEGPEILILCFGAIDNALLMADSQDMLSKTINEHLTLKLQLCYAFVDKMYRNQFGRIVCIGSISSQFVKRGQVSYSAATAGLEGMTRALALEVAGRGVTVNLIRAGLIGANSLAAHQTNLAASGRDLKKMIPVGRVGTAADISRTALFLCADSASFITGTSVTVDGGRSLGDALL